ncbi:hypothetical protein COUCH_15880 [Couchioplanes caeruleus]|uniref:DUF6059 family protein n=1 Tax=Couchioplanes caeruleus TaxID=56438 RepID=UPI0020C04435|nr:DUF6059 family protein [Couchioplanes caeruleus]UQU67656.1 hypothetical protein COUCH_15880 [Couchioplanes caeruleus]
MPAHPLLVRCLQCAEIVVALVHNGLVHLGMSLSSVPAGDLAAGRPAGDTTPPAGSPRIEPGGPPDAGRMPGDDEPATGHPERTGHTGPVRGHPERLLPDVPLSQAERELWQELGLYP